MKKKKKSFSLFLIIAVRLRSRYNLILYVENGYFCCCLSLPFTLIWFDKKFIRWNGESFADSWWKSKYSVKRTMDSFWLLFVFLSVFFLQFCVWFGVIVVVVFVFHLYRFCAILETPSPSHPLPTSLFLYRNKYHPFY